MSPVLAVLHNLAHAFLGHAGPPLRAAGLELDERRLWHGDPLPALDEVDAIVSFGGDQSVRGIEDDPVLKAEGALLRDAVGRGLPVLGVCLGAQLLATSGSPVVLPVIATLVAAVLSAGEVIRGALARRVAPADARAAGLGIEASALVTAAIAVALSLTRDAAGLATALVVLVVLGTGFIVTAVFARRRY